MRSRKGIGVWRKKKEGWEERVEEQGVEGKRGEK